MFNVDNKLYPISNGSLTAQQFRSQGREITVSATTTYDTSAYPEIDNLLDGTADGQLRWDGGSLGSVTIDMQNFQNTKHSAPGVEDKGFMHAAFQLRASKDDVSTPEMAITIAS